MLNIEHGRYCERGPTVYSPYPRRLESLTICMPMKLQRKHFLLSYFKTLSNGLARVDLIPSCKTARCSTNRATRARSLQACPSTISTINRILQLITIKSTTLQIQPKKEYHRPQTLQMSAPAHFYSLYQYYSCLLYTSPSPRDA